MSEPIQTPPELHQLIEANGRMWAAEAEVFACYFNSGGRTPATDCVWLARQCYKELIDGVANRLGAVTLRQAERLDTAAIADIALCDEVVVAELRHYIDFASAYRLGMAASGMPVPAHGGRIGEDWPENDQLHLLRSAHAREHGAIGVRAHAFTEGGYCTLYSAGMALTGTSAVDRAIAAACAAVMDDEWDHMIAGIAGLAEAPLDRDDWQLLERLSIAQGRLRIRMRNAQFDYPLTDARIRELEKGAAAPLGFDYARAGLLPP